MTERTGVWEPLRNATGDRVDWMRLENLVGTGMPDVNGCLNGVEAWLELKLVRSGNKIHFQPTQPAWIFRRTAHGGRVFILVRKADVLRLYHGSQIKELVDQGITVQPVLLLQKPFDWNLLLDTVYSHMRWKVPKAA